MSFNKKKHLFKARLYHWFEYLPKSTPGDLTRLSIVAIWISNKECEYHFYAKIMVLFTISCQWMHYLFRSHRFNYLKPWLKLRGGTRGCFSSSLNCISFQWRKSCMGTVGYLEDSLNSPPYDGEGEGWLKFLSPSHSSSGQYKIYLFKRE